MENLDQVHYMGVHVMFSPQISYNIVVLSVFFLTNLFKRSVLIFILLPDHIKIKI